MYKAKKVQSKSVNTIASYRQAVTETQKWPVTNKFTWGWHVTATQGFELATSVERMAEYLSDNEEILEGETEADLWLKVATLTVTPATDGEY